LWVYIPCACVYLLHTICLAIFILADVQPPVPRMFTFVNLHLCTGHKKTPDVETTGENLTMNNNK